jgi:nucleoside-diphosphate-sugar epimerase
LLFFFPSTIILTGSSSRAARRGEIAGLVKTLVCQQESRTSIYYDRQGQESSKPVNIYLQYLFDEGIQPKERPDGSLLPGVYRKFSHMNGEINNNQTPPILVTGGTGFLGQHLVRMLLAQGRRVRILARQLQKAPSWREKRREKLLNSLQQEGAELAWGDMTDIKAVRAAVSGVEQVFHLAGRLFIWGAPEQEYIDLHIEGTRGLLEACIHEGTLRAFVHCSSTGVLGPTENGPLSEDAPVRPSNIYEATKAEAEQLALEAHSSAGLPVVAARPGLVYGPGDLHLLSWFRAIQRRYFRFVGSGDNQYHPVYVQDTVRGMLLCAESAAATGRIYHLVGKEPASIRKLSEVIAETLSTTINPRGLNIRAAYAAASIIERLPGRAGEPPLLTRSRVRFMTENRLYSGDRARKELNFSPEMDLDSGMKCTVEWYRREGLL